MTVDLHRVSRRGRSIVLVALLVGAVTLVGGSQPAVAAPGPVGLGTADSFAVLAGSTVTNTGPSTINGNLGVHPGTAVVGFPPGTVNGSIHAGDAVAAQAKTDLVTAYNDAAGRPADVTVTSDLGGQTLVSGVYRSNTSLGLTGALTLDAQGNADAVWIFQAGSTLTTASASSVNLIGGAQACNVYWQIGSSATLGTNSTFRGTIMALESITVTTGTTIEGRALARNAAVTLDSNTITRTSCANPSGGGGGTGGTGPGGTGGTGPGGTGGTGPGGTGGTGPGGTGGTGPGGTGGTGTDGAGTGGQVRRVPAGGVGTGGGATAGVEGLSVLALGGGLLAAAGGAWFVRRRVT